MDGSAKSIDSNQWTQYSTNYKISWTDHSVTGTLEQINIHDKNIFYLYPTTRVGKIKCLFSTRFRKKAIEAIDQYVEVYGRLKYKKGMRLPYEVLVSSISIYPPEEELPNLNDLKGIAPGMLEGKSTEEFLWEVRNEWQ